MGKQRPGQPIPWKDAKTKNEQIKSLAVEEFLRLWECGKDRDGDVMKWGDEVRNSQANQRLKTKLFNYRSRVCWWCLIMSKRMSRSFLNKLKSCKNLRVLNEILWKGVQMYIFFRWTFLRSLKSKAFCFPFFPTWIRSLHGRNYTWESLHWNHLVTIKCRRQHAI